MFIQAHGQHDPNTCPMFNKGIRDALLGGASGISALAAETKVNPVSWYHVALDHNFNIVFETDSTENVTNFLLKSGLASWNRFRLEEVIPIETAVKMLSQL